MSKSQEKRLKYSVLRPIAFLGGRVEAGTVLEVTPEQAQDLDLEYVKLVKKGKEKEEPTPDQEGADGEGKAEGGEGTDGAAADENAGSEIDV